MKSIHISLDHVMLKKEKAPRIVTRQKNPAEAGEVCHFFLVHLGKNIAAQKNTRFQKQ